MEQNLKIVVTEPNIMQNPISCRKRPAIGFPNGRPKTSTADHSCHEDVQQEYCCTEQHDAHGLCESSDLPLILHLDDDVLHDATVGRHGL